MHPSVHSRRLPIGVQTFRKVREECGYYVDKTGFALQLVEEGTHYFLSRPRRFGKSLFLDTLREMFRCSRELFEGLAIEPHWDWSRPHPVVRLSFGAGSFNEPGGLHRAVMARLDEVEEDEGIESRHESGVERLADLIRQLHRKAGRGVAVLVDEYDKPILDALGEPKLARANREYLRNLYAVIKASDEHVRFCFLTGVSRFSKASLFSGLNSLEDITLQPRYSSICGYRERDLDEVFGAWLEGLDRVRIREWYSGYGWGGEERVYNPFDVLLHLRNRVFSNWWFETGSPKLLVDLLIDQGVLWHRLDGKLTSDALLSKFDVGDIAPEALLFQTGYLTILGREESYGDIRYRLGFPNREVRQSLNRSLLGSLPPRGSAGDDDRFRLADLMAAGDLAGVEVQLRALLAGIPHDWHRSNPMGDYEGWYASVLYAHFAALGVEVRVEESGSRGRLDLVVRGWGRVYVFELKMRERAGPETAMEQIKDRGYADRYRGQTEPIHLVGVEFSAETRSVTDFATETIRA